MQMALLQILIMAAGFVLLIKGADFFVKGASSIARKFGVPQIIIGLTVVAMGTSAPEAAVSISAALSGNADITIGNVVGSNILNIFVILGITALVAPVPVGKSTVRVDIPVVLLISLLLLPMGLAGRSIDRLEGAILLAIFVAYMVYLLQQARKNKVEDQLEDPELRPIFGQGNGWTALFTLGGLAMIIAGSKLTVYAASELALGLGVSQRMIGLTIVAFGTSLPELVTSVMAARRGDTGIAIGNIVGSNIFNILFVTGLTALITPIAFVRAFTFDTLVSAFAALLLWVFTLKSGRLGRVSGVIMLGCYAGYFAYVVLQ